MNAAGRARGGGGGLCPEAPCNAVDLHPAAVHIGRMMVAFRKMHGLGNDFVVIDARDGGIAVDPALARALANRRTGVGCDQVLVIEPPQDSRATAFMRVRNADGSEAAACGNGSRCVAAALMGESGSDSIVLETDAGLLPAQRGRNGSVSVDLGPLRTDWREIPLSRAVDTLHVPLALGPLNDAVCGNVGNPHATFFVDDVKAIAIDSLGPTLEHDSLFPEGANIGIASLIGPDRLRVRVWERGSGLTAACGTGASAAAAAAFRRGLVGRVVQVVLDGGELTIALGEDNHVVMSGPAATSFSGDFDPDALA